jgi:NitT/TauT family transport system substrate-binding protein
VTAIEKAQEALKVLKKVTKEIDVKTYVNDKFIRQAASEFGYDYEARLKDYAAQPFTEKAVDTGASVSDPKLAGQIWVKGEPKVRLYSSVAATFAALGALEGENKGVRVTFVHDRVSGNKLFADKVWYVEKEGQLSAFLLKPAAEQFARENGGSVSSYDAARKRILASSK